MGKSLDAIKVLILVNVAFFAASNYLLPEMNLWFALYFPENPNFQVWQLVTTMFMHGGIAHILLNMYALWAFGTPLEQMWGDKRFLVFYFLSGIGASVIYLLVNYFQFHAIYDELIQAGASAAELQTWLNTAHATTRDVPAALSSFSVEKIVQFYELYNTPAVGASGAIYGVLVAFGMSFPNAKLALIFLPVPIAAKYFIPILLALDLFSGVTGVSIFGGGIAHFAHIGGAIIGFILMWSWRKKYPQY
jgi:membrane associated rhomboid family serine protease